MTGAESFLDTIREENRTPLSRLGSSKSLYAATDGEIDTEPVLRAAADAEYAAWQTFAAWADVEADDTASETFATIADEERGHYETVCERLDDHEPTATPALHEYLRARASTIERAGALVGRILASERSKEQVVGYFVGDADPGTASLFRDLRADLDAQLERTIDLLEAVCETDDDWTRAEAAATGAIETAYGAYVESLESMGANPKPVC